MILPSSQKRKRRHPGCVAELSKEKTTAPMGCGPQGEGCGGGGARWAEGSAERVVVLKYSCHELEARWGKITSWPIHKFKFAFDLDWVVGWVGGWVGGGWLGGGWCVWWLLLSAIRRRRRLDLGQRRRRPPAEARCPSKTSVPPRGAGRAPVHRCGRALSTARG